MSKQEQIQPIQETNAEGKDLRKELENITKHVSNFKYRLDVISNASPEEQKKMTEEWIEEIKGRDEDNEEKIKETRDGFDELMEEAKKEGKLKEKLKDLYMSIGNAFDDYTILSQTLEKGYSNYLDKSAFIKRCVKVRDDNNISPADCFGMLESDIGYFGKKLKEKIADSYLSQEKKEEKTMNIDKMMEK